MISPENASFLQLLAGLGLKPDRIRTLGSKAAITTEDLDFFLDHLATADSSDERYTVSPSSIKETARESSGDKDDFRFKTTEPKLQNGKPTSTFKEGPPAPIPKNRFLFKIPNGWKPKNLTTKNKYQRFF